MFGGGGFFGGGGHPHQQEREPVDTETLYKMIGVEKTATHKEIKKAFRKLAMTHHPDKGGDPEEFKKINKAYEVLGDEEKRRVYDEYGLEGLQGGGGGGGGGNDIFEMFGFGGGGRGGRGGGRGGRGGKRKGEDVVFPLKVSLEDLYNGTTKKLRLTKSVLCKTCDGKGGMGDAVHECAGCKGRGIRIVVRQIGPGMIQQMQSYCDECQGTGTVIPEKDRCKTCEGNKTAKEKKTLEVFVNRGMKHGEKIVFRGEGDEAPNTVPGDVVVVLQQKEHDAFQRRGPDLFIRRNITLSEALCGYEFTVNHLDGRCIVIKTGEGQIISDGDLKRVDNEGMPMAKNPYSRGNLYVEMHVKMPERGQLAPNTIKLLRKILPEPEAAMAVDELPEEHEIAELEDVDLEAERRRFQQEQEREAYEEDEEGHGHPGNACRQA